MRHLLWRCIEAVAGVVYQFGVDLYRLADWIDNSDETDLTEADVEVMWNNGTPTTMANSGTTVTWTSSRYPGKSGG